MTCFVFINFLPHLNEFSWNNFPLIQYHLYEIEWKYIYILIGVRVNVRMIYYKLWLSLWSSWHAQAWKRQNRIFEILSFNFSVRFEPIMLRFEVFKVPCYVRAGITMMASLFLPTWHLGSKLNGFLFSQCNQKKKKCTSLCWKHFVARSKSNFEWELIPPFGYGDNSCYLPKKRKRVFHVILGVICYTRLSWHGLCLGIVLDWLGLA